MVLVGRPKAAVGYSALVHAKDVTVSLKEIGIGTILPDIPQEAEAGGQVISPNQNPIDPALGWGTLIAGAVVLVRAMTRHSREKRTSTLKLSEAILGGGLVLLGLELVVPELPDAVRLPLVVGSVAAMATGLAVRRLARRVA
jgi:hypothetical protein